MDENTIQIDVAGLDKLIRIFKQRMPTAKVGILGRTANRKGETSGPTNADIGAALEFGSSKVPQRSFLRMPLNTYLNEYLEKSKAFDEKTLKEVMKYGNILSWMTKIAVVAEAVVIDAFNSAGFGKWAPWSQNYHNKTGTILVDTTQLRGSITSEVK